MFIQVSHTRLDVFQASRDLVLACYKHTPYFPAEEKFGLPSQIRRAAFFVHLNIAEGSSRKPGIERKRFYETARSFVIEIDTALDPACQLNYTNTVKLNTTGTLILKCFQMLSKMNER